MYIQPGHLKPHPWYKNPETLVPSLAFPPGPLDLPPRACLLLSTGSAQLLPEHPATSQAPGGWLPHLLLLLRWTVAPLGPVIPNHEQSQHLPESYSIAWVLRTFIV